MHLSTLLEMAASVPDRVAFGTTTDGLSYGELFEQSRRAAAWAVGRGAGRVGLVDVNSNAIPVLLYGSALAGVPFAPINYRLDDEQLRSILERTAPSVVVVDDWSPRRFRSTGISAARMLESTNSTSITRIRRRAATGPA